MKKRIRFPWHLFVAMGCLACLGLSVSSFGDTYNFYFQKPKKDQPEEEAAEAPAENKSVTAPAAAPAPIVINNTNNNQVGGQGQSISSPTTTATAGTNGPPPSTPPAGPPVPPSSSESAGALTASVSGSPSRPSRWRLGVASSLTFQDATYNASTGYPMSYRSDYWGGVVSMGYGLSDAVWLVAHGGARLGTGGLYGHLGADLEFLPFRFGWSEKWNLFEFGFLAGVSTQAAARSNYGSVHLGARANINIGSEFGITAGGRANLGYVMFEAGLTARL